MCTDSECGGLGNHAKVPMRTAKYQPQRSAVQSHAGFFTIALCDSTKTDGTQFNSPVAT